MGFYCKTCSLRLPGSSLWPGGLTRACCDRRRGRGPWLSDHRAVGPELRLGQHSLEEVWGLRGMSSDSSVVKGPGPVN